MAASRDWRREKREAMESVEANAGITWGEIAYGELLNMIATREAAGIDTFIAADFFAHMHRLAKINPAVYEPHDWRALGPVVHKAARRKVISEVATVPHPNRHGAKTPVWTRTKKQTSFAF